MNTRDIKTFIKSWIDANTGLTSIALDSNGLRLDLPYITYLLRSFNPVHSLGYVKPDLNGDYTIYGNVEFVLSLVCYGDNIDRVTPTYKYGEDYLMDLYNSLSKFSVEEEFRLQNLAFLNNLTPVTPINTGRDSKIEKRVILDLLFRTTENISDNIDIIETVTSEATYDNFGRIINDTIEIGG